MLEQYHELRLDAPIAPVFWALIAIVAVGRWDALIDVADTRLVPRSGTRYAARRRRRYCSGVVLECLRPVSLIVHETLYRTPSHVRLRLKWRVEPVESGSLLKFDIKAELNSAARLRRRNWDKKLESDARRLFAAISRRLEIERRAQKGRVLTSGQNIGRKAIVARKTTSVSGRPIFR